MLADKQNRSIKKESANGFCAALCVAAENSLFSFYIKIRTQYQDYVRKIAPVKHSLKRLLMSVALFFMQIFQEYGLTGFWRVPSHTAGQASRMWQINAGACLA